MAEIERCDLLFVPGGIAATEAANDEVFMREFRRLAATARYLTSVCTGSLILGAAGLLKGKRAACHWAWRDLLPLFGAIPDPARVVRDGNVITGGGVTAGIDFALVVAAELGGEELAQSLQLALEYAPGAALRLRPTGDRAARRARRGEGAHGWPQLAERDGVGQAGGGAAIWKRARLTC